MNETGFDAAYDIIFKSPVGHEFSHFFVELQKIASCFNTPKSEGLREIDCVIHLFYPFRGFSFYNRTREVAPVVAYLGARENIEHDRRISPYPALTDVMRFGGIFSAGCDYSLRNGTVIVKKSALNGTP